MDLEDIEDLYSKDDEEPLQRLQMDEVIVRVKRHRVNHPLNGVKLDTNGLDSVSEDDDQSDCETDESPENAQPQNGTGNRVNKKLYRAEQRANRKPKANCTSGCSCERDGSCQTKKKKTPVDTLNNALPGQARVFVKTWGCAHNNSDSEYMAGLLNSYGYTIVNDEEMADLWLLNSCTVKGPAEQHFANYVQQALEKGIRVVVAGCVSQSAPTARYLERLSIVGVQQIDRVVEVVEETLKGNTVRFLKLRNPKSSEPGNGRSLKRLTRLNMPKIRRNPLIEIVAINVGCLNQCTYCKTKHARGELASYSMREIVERVLVSVQEGVREVWLTSEDTGAYGKDLADQGAFKHDRFDMLFDTSIRFDSSNVNQIDLIKPTIANLLRCVLGALPSDCRLRLGMTNPPYILEHLQDIANIMQTDQRIYKFLHIPVQSGSDEVLSDMKREYSRADFEHIVDYMRKNVPGINIATDLILGFPTETEENFEQTMQLIEKYNFSSLFINQFYPRPGTPAAKMKLIPPNKVRQRTQRASKYFRSYLPYEGRVGQVYTALVTEVSSDRQHFVAHNEFYEQILIPKDDYYLGKMIEVRIVSISKYCMVGEITKEAGQLVRMAELVQRKISLNALLAVSALVSSLLLIYRLRKSQSLN